VRDAQLLTAGAPGTGANAPAPLRKADRLAGLFLGACVLLAFAAVATDKIAAPAVAGITCLVIFAASHRWLLAWRTMLGAIILVILFIPIKRYELPVNLPLQLEPYRILVLATGTALVGSLLIDENLRWRPTPFDFPIAMIVLALLLSVLTRSSHILDEGVGEYVFRYCLFFISYIIVFYLMTLALTKRSDVEALVKLLVGGAAVVAIATIYQSRTGYNIFDHLGQWLPLRFNGIPYTTDRGGGARAYASAQHPIAMGAALMMLVPLGIYLARRTGQRRWVIATLLLLLGALATKSRTGIIMMVVLIIAIWILQPAPTRRMIPKLLPLLVVVHVALPGTLSTFKNTFFPSGGIVASETQTDATWRVNYGRGRIGEWNPALKEWSHTPLFGQGVGTRVNDLNDPKFNAPILDDQWLGSILDVGAFGLVALLWFFVLAVRKFGRVARRNETDDGWLMTALTASVASYAFGMLTFDAFNFVQVTMLMFLLVAFGTVMLRATTHEDERAGA
jgi:polysaccharide biosynthesis protein PslJ